MGYTNVLNFLKIEQDEYDRIIGGMIRTEAQCMTKPYSQFVTCSLKLGKTTEQKSLIWYLIGCKVGLTSSDLIYMQKKGNATKRKKKEFEDPSVA